MGTFTRYIPVAERTLAPKHIRIQAQGQPTTPAPVTWRFEFPNPVELRGIPAIGRGVAGAIRDTKPGGNLD